MKGPALGPGGEDITWPDQVAPWGRKASSTRKIKPQTSNLKPHLGWFSVGVKQFEEARATGLACHGAYSRLLTRWSLRSPGGPEVRSRSLSSVGGLYSGRAVVCYCVCGCGRRRGWRTMVLLTLVTPFRF